MIVNQKGVSKKALFDLHLQISRILKIYHRCHIMLIIFCHVTLINFCHTFCLKRPSLICSFHITKRYVSISILFIICCSVSLFLSPKVPLLLHLTQIYRRFRPCFFYIFVLLCSNNFRKKSFDN